MKGLDLQSEAVEVLHSPFGALCGHFDVYGFSFARLRNLDICTFLVMKLAENTPWGAAIDHTAALAFSTRVARASL